MNWFREKLYKPSLIVLADVLLVTSISAKTA
jgi:hypothetical protein